MKGVKMILTPEILVKEDVVKAGFRMVWDSFSSVGYGDCLDSEGQLLVTILIGKPDTDKLKGIRLADLVT